MIRLAYVSPMFRLAYVSNARLGLNQNDLDSIMHTSKLRNKLAGVTGLLLFNGVNFMQVLEGDRHLVGCRGAAPNVLRTVQTGQKCWLGRRSFCCDYNRLVEVP